MGYTARDLPNSYTQDSMPLQFQGPAWALSADGLAAVTDTLGVQPPEIWAVLSVETFGCGYLPDRRPQILYERHVFHRLTHGRFDDEGDISAATPGGYGARGAHQYLRLAAAIEKDRDAALQSASWGIGQIMGANHVLAGFQSVEEMVTAMSESEDRQLAAMSSFLHGAGLRASLLAHDWAAFARGYNGPNYAANRYDVRLKQAFRKYSAGPSPDLTIRAAQLYLTYLGFRPGRIDGLAGTRTQAALAQFQAQRELSGMEAIDATTVAQLISALTAQAKAATSAT